MNLTEISIAFRKLLVFGVIGIFVFLMLRVMFGISVSSLASSQVVPPPLPDVRFSKLPKPQFTGLSSTSGLKFALQNIEGRPPETTDSGKVYAMPKKLPTLLSADRAKQFAKKLNFSSISDQPSSVIYRYFDPKNPLYTLELDSVNLNFTLKYDFANNPKFVFNPMRSVTTEKAIAEVKNFIQFNQLFDATITGGKSTAVALTYQPQTKNFRKALSLSAADAVQIHYFRSDLDGMKVLPPGFDTSFNYALYSPNDTVESNILELSYTFWPIAFDDFATYPLKSSSQAWQDLVDGYGFTVRLGNNKPDQIVIRNIYLAYYDSQDPQSYLQPVFVFEGDNDYVAYVEAITSDWLQ
jgi:hypothetical protein